MNAYHSKAIRKTLMVYTDVKLATDIDECDWVYHYC